MLNKINLTICIFLSMLFSTIITKAQQDSCACGFWNSFNFELWRYDSLGCMGYRNALASDFLKQAACLEGKVIADIYPYLGQPNYVHTLLPSSKHDIYCYWLECGPEVSEGETLSKFVFYMVMIQIYVNKKTRKIHSCIWSGPP